MKAGMYQADVDVMSGTLGVGHLLPKQGEFLKQEPNLQTSMQKDQPLERRMVRETLEGVENLAASRAGDFVDMTSTVDPCLDDMYKEARPSLVGIHKLRAELESRMSSSPNLTILSIYGVGGLGKTTLANAVYQNIKGDFSCSAFVSVGQRPVLRDVLRNILIDLGNEVYMDLNMTKLNEKQLIDELQYFLQSKSFLIVVDDIWDIPAWEVIKSALVESGCGSRVITTSRSIDVAKTCGEVFKLMPLSIADSKELFYGKLFDLKGSITFDLLDEQSTNILQKCGGLPLAIITMASALAYEPQEEWPKLYNSIGFGHDDNHLDITSKILQLCYNVLPAHLKSCLLYLSIFPEDKHVIEKDTLLWRWIAEGFVHEEQGDAHYKVAERYFNELINRSMIQATEDEYTNTISACSVHDMVSGIIFHAGTEEKLIFHAGTEDNFVTILDSSDDGLHLSNHSSNANMLAAQNRVLEEHDLDRIICNNPKLRSINFYGCRISSMMSLLPSSQVLRVLCLEDCEVDGAQYSDGLKNLMGFPHLRYLGLRGTNIWYLPTEIGALKYLQTLDLRHTCIKALPHSISLLKQLKCLRCSDPILELPEGMGNLTSLEELLLGTVGNDPCFAKELSKLTQLRVLHICVENLGDKEKEALVECLSKLKKIEELVLTFDGLGSEEPYRYAIAPGAFPRLRYLKINNWLMYEPGAMPYLGSVELHVHVRAFNDASFDFHDLYTLRCLRVLDKVHVAIVCWEATTAEAEEVEATLRRVVQHHPNRPTLILKKLGCCADDKKITEDFSSGSTSPQRDVQDKQMIRSLGTNEKLCHSRVAQVMPLELLKKITNNFSTKRKLGSGTFGTVYKGVQIGKEIAVKLLHRTQRPDYEDEFKRELDNLRGLNHHNIIQLLGYCYEIKRELVEYKGSLVFADNIYRALCFEYMHNGSLQGHLSDEFHGLDWHTRYKIIKGTCEGLKYLHEGLESPMYHLDLKPGNILLDKNMVAKLADFGLSKLVCDNQTQATSRSLGTIRYCPPEHIECNYVNNKFDIFSLGVVMIEIVAGLEGYRKADEMSRQEFMDHVQENWRKRLQATPGCASPKYECHQVKRCIEIALDCARPDRKQRPDNIGDITNWLSETENNSENCPRLLPHKRRHDTVL